MVFVGNNKCNNKSFKYQIVFTKSSRKKKITKSRRHITQTIKCEIWIIEMFRSRNNYVNNINIYIQLLKKSFDFCLYVQSVVPRPTIYIYIYTEINILSVSLSLFYFLKD